jgi:hypothetical protein
MLDWVREFLQRCSPAYEWVVEQLKKSSKSPVFDELPQRAWGHLRLEWHNPRTGESGVDDGDNIVVNAGRLYYLNRFSPQFTSTIQPITSMRAGDGGCGLSPAISALFTPVPFSLTDTGLRSSIGLTTLNDPNPVINSSSLTITFVCNIFSNLASAGNYHFTPRVINELALLSGDGSVVALRSFRSIPFDPADSVVVRATWTLGIT